MIDRLNAMLEKYDELSNKLTSEEVLNNYELLKNISKEKSDLEETVDTYKEYKKVIDDIENTKEMLNDPDLKDIASEELTSLENRKEELNKKLELINPLKVLKRGYSVLYKNNNIINSIKNLKISDNLVVKVVDGLVYVNINKLEEINEKENI